VNLLTSKYIPPVSYWNRWGMNMNVKDPVELNKSIFIFFAWYEELCL
jgi:hypothetical protein